MSTLCVSVNYDIRRAQRKMYLYFRYRVEFKWIYFDFVHIARMVDAVRVHIINTQIKRVLHFVTQYNA